MLLLLNSSAIGRFQRPMMYLLAVLVLEAFATLVRGQVIVAPEISVACKAGKRANGQVCANLAFYDENDKVLHYEQGTNVSLGIKGVAKVRVVGDYGCYTIYKRKNHRSSSLCWTHMNKVNLNEAGYEYSVVRCIEPNILWVNVPDPCIQYIQGSGTSTF